MLLKLSNFWIWGDPMTQLVTPAITKNDVFKAEKLKMLVVSMR